MPPGNLGSVEQYWEEQIDKTEFIDSEEERSLVAQYKSGDIEAGWKLIASHLPLITMWCRNYVCQTTPLGDLVQSSLLDLMTKAMPRFDPDQSRFMTYAEGTVLQACRVMVAKSSRGFSLPNDIKRRINLTANLLEEGIEPEECCQIVAQRENIKRVGVIRHLLHHVDSVSSLDTPIGEGTDTLADKQQDYLPELSVQTEQRWLNSTLADVIAQLPKDAQEVLVNHNGLFGRPPMTYQEIATPISVTMSAIQQRGYKAQKRLREIIAEMPEVLDYFRDMGYELS